MNVDEYESLPTNNIVAHMTAGAIAGVLEHCVMYPLDSVKTRMQSFRKVDVVANRNIRQTFVRMVEKEGIFRPVRGMSAVVVGSGPAHALYFSCYEFIKSSMVQKIHNPTYNTLIYGAAGCISTLLHDAVMNPAEVVKQRLQMSQSPYNSVLECIINVYKKEGMKAFYRSYTTQLTMNIPFQSIHFMTYEFMQTIFNKEGQYNPRAHMLSGAIAGGVASAATTPLDVCKTLLNTQETKTVHGLTEAIGTVYKLGGPTGFFRGIQARVLYTMPATAICWSTYEFFKYVFGATYKVEADLGSYQSSKDDRGPSNWAKDPTNDSNNSNLAQLKTRELPSMSGAGLYGTVSFNTVHAKDNCSVSGMHKGNSLLDIKHT